MMVPGRFHGPDAVPTGHWPELSLVSHLIGGRLDSGGQHVPQVVSFDPGCLVCHGLSAMWNL